MTGIPLSEALAMATINPGRFANRSGVIAIGSRADLIRFRWTNEMILEDVWLAGEPMDVSKLARGAQRTKFCNG
jgi:N-acetylglucosamine-6-phosphate deacetylase